MPPSVPYMNRTAPLWDFIASLEEQGSEHPFFSQFNQAPPSNTDANDRGPHESFAPPPFGPWGWGMGGLSYGTNTAAAAAEEGSGIPFRPRGRGAEGRRHHHRERGEEESREFEKEFEEELTREFGGEEGEREKGAEKEKDGGNDNGEGPSASSGSETEGRCRLWRGRRGEHCGSARRGCGRHAGPRGLGWGGPGAIGPRPHGPHHHGHHGHGRRGWGGRGGPFFGRGGWGEPPQPPFNPLAFLAPLFSPDAATTAIGDGTDDFTPDADIFDTPTAYIIHISLPGAKKEDIGVNWDADKSELNVAGVVYRPADEELLEQLAVAERKVGAFERKVRLGTRANPANVDVDGISAKLEDGVLRVEVRKMGEAGFVEVRRVDVE